METTIRRYDIDWIRVIAIGLLVVYHIGIGFQPWGVFIQFIQNDQPLNGLWIPMSMLNIWRIPLLFFVSGMGLCFALRKRNWWQLMLERSRRILLPFIFGIIFVVPVHIFIWQMYYKQDLVYTIHPVHLWFLGNIFIYVIVLSPLFFYLKKNENGKIHRWVQILFRNPLGLLFIIVAFILEATIIRPDTYETYSMTLHGFFMGMLAFMFGFLIIYSGENFWKTVLRMRWFLISSALVLFLSRYFIFNLKAPDYLLSTESVLWIMTVFGFAYKYLNHPGEKLSYLSQAAYPVYIIHMVFLYLGSYFIMSLDFPATLKFIIIIVLTFTGSFVFYEFVIRRISFIRPLFGLKERKATQTVIKTEEDLHLIPGNHAKVSN
jgi:peptidoglycan/LPS O-acetylase OafA/YrhL